MRNLVLGLVLTGIAGCGFQLRDTQGFEISAKSLSVSATNLNSQFSQELKRMLTAQGVALVPVSGAEYLISILSERTTRRPVATSADISVSEYELRLETRFQLTNANGELLIGPTMLVTERIYSFDRSSLVGNTEEEELLTEEMRQDIASQLLRRLSARLRNLTEVSAS